MKYSNVCFSKVVLNKLVKKIKFKEAIFDIPYWGALDQHFGVQAHSHYFYEVTLITSGTGDYIQNGQKIAIKKIH